MKDGMNSSSPRIFALSYLDIQIRLDLKERDLIEHNLDYDFLNLCVDTEMIELFVRFRNRIILSSGDSLISMLLYMNKSSKCKILIELLLYNKLEFNINQNKSDHNSKETSKQKSNNRNINSFLKELVLDLLEENYLFIEEPELNSLKPNKIELLLMFKTKEIRAINLESLYNKESKYELVKTLKDKITPNRLFYFIYDISSLITSKITYNDALSFIQGIKSYHASKVLGILYTLEISHLDIDKLSLVQNVINMSDTIFLTRDTSKALFNLLKHNTSENLKSTKLSKQQNLDFFINNIPFLDIMASTRIDSSLINFKGQTKLGVFLDDNLHTCSIIHKSKNTINIFNEYKFDILPQITHLNINHIAEYKKIIRRKKDFLHSVFFGAFSSRLIRDNSYSLCFRITNNLISRILRLFRLGLDLPKEEEFYHANQSDLIENAKDYDRCKQKEAQFRLDCTNVVDSKLKTYNPLFDKTLVSFLNCKSTRKHLEDIGIIDSSGVVINNEKSQNSDYAEGSIDKTQRDRSMLIAIKENALKINGENLTRQIFCKYKNSNDSSIKDIYGMTKRMFQAHDSKSLIPTRNSTKEIYSKIDPRGKSYVKSISSVSIRNSKRKFLPNINHNSILSNSVNTKDATTSKTKINWREIYQ